MSNGLVKTKFYIYANEILYNGNIFKKVYNMHEKI